MPKGTRVDRCYEELKGSKGESSAAAICQSSTGQNLHTGKPLKKKKRKRGGAMAALNKGIEEANHG